MDILEIIAFFCALLIGLSLGLIGGGGSILTVPVLVYLLDFEAVQATAYSLFIVGATAVFGALRSFRNGLLDLKMVLVFGLPSIVAVYFTRAFIVPALPDVMGLGMNLEFQKSTLILVLFAGLMVLAALSMISGKKKAKARKKLEAPWSWMLILGEGVGVGVLTGMVGAGGGFLIIPVLVVVSGMEMKRAVGTSLAIIALKSLIGFSGDLGQFDIDWTFLLSFSALSVVGIFIGTSMAKRIQGAKLKPIFGYFVLLMGTAILLKELLG